MDTDRRERYRKLTGTNLLLNPGSKTEKKFKLRRFLGAGSFSGCFEAIYPASTSIDPNSASPAPVEQKFCVCVARVTARPDPGLNKPDRTEEETRLWRSLNHPNIVACFGHLSSQQYHIQFAEYLRGGTMWERLHKHKQMQEFIPTETIVRWITEVGQALDYLHDMNIAHFDVKPSNIVFRTTDNSSPAKLIDFGVAQNLNEKKECGFRGSPRFASPEMHQRGLTRRMRTMDTMPGCASDVWSLGIVFYQALFGTFPFASQPMNDNFAIEILSAKIQWNFAEDCAIPGHVQMMQVRVEQFRAVLSGMLEFNPANRWTIKQVLASLLSQNSSGS